MLTKIQNYALSSVTLKVVTIKILDNLMSSFEIVTFGNQRLYSKNVFHIAFTGIVAHIYKAICP